MKQTSIIGEQALHRMSFAFSGSAHFVPRLRIRALPRSSGDRTFHANLRASELAQWTETGGDYLATELAEPSRPADSIALIQQLSRDEDSPEVLNFPFVLAIFLLLFAGSAVFVCGMCVANFWLMSFGACVTLTASLAYGQSLSKG